MQGDIVATSVKIFVRPTSNPASSIATNCILTHEFL